MTFQTPIWHELVDEHPVTFIHAISDQVDKIPMMESTEKIYLRLEFSLSLGGIWSKDFDGSNLTAGHGGFIDRTERSLSQNRGEINGSFFYVPKIYQDWR